MKLINSVYSAKQEFKTTFEKNVFFMVCHINPFLHDRSYSSIFRVIVSPRCSLKFVNAISFAFCYLGRQVGVIFLISFSCKNWQKTSFSQVQHAQTVTLYRESYSERKFGAKCNVSKTPVYIAIVNSKLRRSYSDLRKVADQRKPLRKIIIE